MVRISQPSSRKMVTSSMRTPNFPGIYLPGKFAVRIEVVTILRQDGCETLTKFPKDLIIF